MFLCIPLISSYGFGGEKFVRVKKTRHKDKRKLKSSFVIFGVPKDPKVFIFGVHSRILGSGTPNIGVRESPVGLHEYRVLVAGTFRVCFRINLPSPNDLTCWLSAQSTFYLNKTTFTIFFCYTVYFCWFWADSSSLFFCDTVEAWG